MTTTTPLQLDLSRAFFFTGSTSLTGQFELGPAQAVGKLRPQMSKTTPAPPLIADQWKSA